MLNPTLEKTVKAKLFPSGREIRVTPNLSVIPIPIDDESVARVAIAGMQNVGDGTLRPVIRVHERWVKLTMDLPEKLGMGVGYWTLRKLMRAGFVNSREVAPNYYLVDLASWISHVEACKDDEFWTTDRVKKYAQSNY